MWLMLRDGIGEFSSEPHRCHGAISPQCSSPTLYSVEPSDMRDSRGLKVHLHFLPLKAKPSTLNGFLSLIIPLNFFDIPPVLFLSKEAPELVGAKEIYTHPTVYSVSAMWTKQLIEYILRVGAWFSYFKLVSSVLKVGRKQKKYTYTYIVWVSFLNERCISDLKCS